MPRVLIVTGGLLALEETDGLGMLKRQLASFRRSRGAWMDLHVKATTGRRLAVYNAYRASSRYRGAPYRGPVESLLRAPRTDIPELTEVVLATALLAEGFEVETTTWAGLVADKIGGRERLARADVAFVSTTLIRDLGECEALLALVVRPGLKVVLGGALVGLLQDSWPKLPGVDLVAVGYGEWLVPALAGWMRGGELEAPEHGRIEERNGVRFVRSGTPDGKSLDFLPTPDWKLAGELHGRTFDVVSYESVRGCPYRCAFCNYPYLFDDVAFRTKSAERIATDWIRYAAEGVRHVVCLDSLFTVPKKRLVALCERLVAAGSPLTWTCYARVDDLTDAATVRLMRKAGCGWVQIGLESGSQAQLDRMNKQTSVEAAGQALDTCRDEGIVTLVTLVVGFPGEDASTLAETSTFLARYRPDLFFTSPLSLKYPVLPVLQPESRARFGLEIWEEPHTSFPLWRHASMACTEAVDRAAEMAEEMIRNQVSLDAALFYTVHRSLPDIERRLLLDFQADALAHPSATALVTQAVSAGTRAMLKGAFADRIQRS